MPHLKKQSLDSSRIQESAEKPKKPELPTSPPTKTSSKKTSAKKIAAQLVNGSVLGQKMSLTEGESTSSSSDPLPKLKEAQQRLQEALYRLKIKPEELRTVPQFSPYLKMAGGSLTAVLKAIRFVNQDPILQKFLETYDTLPVELRKVIPWEAVALKSGVNIQQFIGAAIFALTSASATAAKIIAVSNHPKVMKASVLYAQMPSGDKDRQMQMQMVGSLPSPKGGVTFIGKAVFGAGKSVMGDEGEETSASSGPADVFTDDDDFEELFPSAKAIQDKLIPIRQKRLGDGK